MTDDPLATVRAKLAAREGKAGFEHNVAELRAIIEAAEVAGYVYRDAATGHYVSAEYAKAHPTTSYRTKLPVT